MYQDRNYHDFVKMFHSFHSFTKAYTVPVWSRTLEFVILEKVAIKVNENLYCFITLIAEDISDDESTVVAIHDIEDLVPVMFCTEDLGQESTQQVTMEIGGSQLQCVQVLKEQSAIHPETGESFRIMKPRDEGTPPYLIKLYKDHSDVELVKTSLTSMKIKVLTVFGFMAL